MWFSLIADEASDISHNEYIHKYLDESDYDIHEDALGLVQLPDTKESTHFSVIKGVLYDVYCPFHSVEAKRQ